MRAQEDTILLHPGLIVIVSLDGQTVLTQSPHELSTISVITDIDALPLGSAYAGGNVRLEGACFVVTADWALGYIIFVDDCELNCEREKGLIFTILFAFSIGKGGWGTYIASLNAGISLLQEIYGFTAKSFHGAGIVGCGCVHALVNSHDPRSSNSG